MSAPPEFQVPHLLAQGVAIDAEKLRRPDLVAAGGRKGRADQRPFDLAQDAVIEARRRQRVLEAGEIFGQVPLDRVRQPFRHPLSVAPRLTGRLGRQQRLGIELRIR